MKIYTDREVRDILKKNGYSLSHCHGSHQKWEKMGNHIVVKHNINPCIFARLIKENGLEI